jgi:hypothetical protein
VYSDTIDKLISTQLSGWELARVNYDQLRLVRTRSISFGSFEIIIQFNPGRIRSSAASVDAKSIESRPCFLCEMNRPLEQRGVEFGDDMTILVNPFPIFPRHLTIPSVGHTLQRILPNFGSMLKLARSIPGFTIFYNGPECGASAPDHFHFQAGNKGFMPIENDYREGNMLELLSFSTGLKIFKWNSYKRNILTIKGDNIENISGFFNRFHNSFSKLQPEKQEPMVNILAGYESDEWIIHIMPRKLHRPAQYFLDGGERILLSPASVDLGGVIITPREEDFNKISKSDIEDIFSQVCLDNIEFQSVLENIL